MSVTKQHDSPRAGPTGRRRQRAEYRPGRFRLRSGDRVSVRQLRREDAPALAATVEQLSERSRYLRFHSGLPRLTEDMVSYLTDIDHHDHEALVAVPRGSDGIIVGVARFIRDPEHPDSAEMAVAVADSWQRRGLGTLLLRRLARRATEVGITHFTADILAENSPTIELMRGLGAGAMDHHGSTVTRRMDVWAVADSDDGAVLRALGRWVRRRPRRPGRRRTSRGGSATRSGSSDTGKASVSDVANTVGSGHLVDNQPAEEGGDRLT